MRKKHRKLTDYTPQIRFTFPVTTTVNENKTSEPNKLGGRGGLLWERVEMRDNTNLRKYETSIKRSKAGKNSPTFRLGYQWDLNFPYRFGKFLCLTADVFPPLDPRFRRDDPKDDNMARVKFMIDSGSDVGSLIDDVIKTLKLPVVGRCVQEGAGGATQERPLYSACLVIGEKKLNIQVRMAKMIMVMMSEVVKYD